LHRPPRPAHFNQIAVARHQIAQHHINPLAEPGAGRADNAEAYLAEVREPALCQRHLREAA
jgi:hypothetical protein